MFEIEPLKTFKFELLCYLISELYLFHRNCNSFPDYFLQQLKLENKFTERERKKIVFSLKNQLKSGNDFLKVSKWLKIWNMVKSTIEVSMQIFLINIFN